MQINIKKTKVIVISKTRNVPCKTVIDGSELEQVSQYKYLGTWITEDGRCELDVKTRIAMAKDAFWKHKELLKGNISLRVKKENFAMLCLPSTKILM